LGWLLNQGTIVESFVGELRIGRAETPAPHWLAAIRNSGHDPSYDAVLGWTGDGAAPNCRILTPRPSSAEGRRVGQYSNYDSVLGCPERVYVGPGDLVHPELRLRRQCRDYGSCEPNRSCQQRRGQLSDNSIVAFEGNWVDAWVDISMGLGLVRERRYRHDGRGQRGDNQYRHDPWWTGHDGSAGRVSDGRIKAVRSLHSGAEFRLSVGLKEVKSQILSW
jgi:hypothetical protein